MSVALSPPGKSMDQAGNDKDFVFANLYVSDKLSAEQLAAMEKLFSEHLALVPPDGSKKHAFKKVALKASFSAAGARVTIPKILELDVRRTEKPYAQDMSAAPFSAKGVDGTQKRYDFSDDGMSWKLKGRNASFASLDFSSQKEAAAAAATQAAPAAPASAAPAAQAPAAAPPPAEKK